MKRASRLLLALALGTGPAAEADVVPAPPNEIDLPPYARVPPCEDDPARPELGTVIAQSGDATRALPGCAPAPLACETVLRAGDRIETGDGAQLAARVGGAWVQLASGTVALLRPDEDGGLVLAVERGRARVMRIGDGVVPRIETAELAALTAAEDVVAQAGGGEASLCSWSDPIEVRTRATGAISRAEGGACVALGAEMAATATLAVSIAEVARCEVAVGDFEPFDVASGPPVGPPPVLPPPLPPPLCISGTCGGTPPPPARIPVVEQPGGYEPPP